MTSAVMGTLALDPYDDPETVWAAIRQAAIAGGLGSLAAARLALAALELVGDQHGPAVAEFALVADASGARMEVAVRGGAGTSATVPTGLIDACSQRTSATGELEHVVAVALDRPTQATVPAAQTTLQAVADAGLDTRRLLAAALIALDHQAARLAATDAETRALLAELDETNQGLVALYAELSDQREQLEQARADAEQASQAKAAFLATMSHEIRSPLNAVTGFAGLLLDTDLAAHQIEYAQTIRTAGHHLRDVVDDILDLAKIESGHLDLEEIPFDLWACVEEAVSLVAPKAEEKKLALAALFTPDTPTLVAGDPVRLRQILVNLLSNAVKFTAHGAVTVEVTARDHADQRCQLGLHVRDTGIGISAETAQRLFTPFTQADTSTTRSYGGTGLGLSICRQLAEQMGGSVTVESTLGIGSTFTCTIPVRLAGPARLDAEHDTPLAGTQVLVVHEQPVTAEAVRRHLASWGAHVVAARSVDDAARRAGEWSTAALAIIEAHHPDTLAENAVRLTAARAGSHLPVVALAPLASRRSLAHLPDNIQAVVTTPVHRSHLRAATLRALGRPQDLPPPATSSTVPAEARPLRILLAEDDPVNQRSAELILGRLGYRLDIVGDGEQAVAAILACDYDLVLMDLQMPNLDGIEATRKVRRQRPGDRPRIVAITASATRDNRQACLQAGMNDFLPKPVEPADLTRLIAETPDRPAVEPTAVGPAHPRPRAGPSRRIRRVLYVDDDPIMVTLVERILAREHDLAVLTAARGDRAFELAAAEHPDIIMLDLNLTDMTGEALLERLKADPRTRTIPAIVVSGDTSPATIKRLTSNGAAHYLTKPFDPASLHALLNATHPPPDDQP